LWSRPSGCLAVESPAMAHEETVKAISLEARNAADAAEAGRLMGGIIMAFRSMNPPPSDLVAVMTIVNLLANMLLECPAEVQDGVLLDLRAGLDRARATR